MVGGFCYVKNGEWFSNLTDKDHIRGVENIKKHSTNWWQNMEFGIQLMTT
jgi:hypothetical protein